MAGNWQPLANQPAFSSGTMMLLTDGRVMVQQGGDKHWHALTPDSNGSYVNGTWSTLADMINTRLYYASGVLRDGRVIVIGGEYSDAGGGTNKGEIYDPVADSWTAIPSPPGWASVSDAASCVLPDGRLMIGAIPNGNCAIYDPVTNSWSAAAAKAVRSNEETWVLLPDDTIVTTQCWNPFQSEKYIISSNTWQNEGALPVTVVDAAMHEIGPAVLLYNGKAIFFGAANESGNGKTVIYTPPANPALTGTWSAGPNLPHIGHDVIVCNDCPGAIMPNGRVLVTGARFVANGWGSPVYFFEYDPVTNTITQAATPPNNNSVVYQSRLMLLPTGQVLFSPSSKNMQCFTPVGGPHEAWRPTIVALVPPPCGSASNSYLLKGTQLNGLSQANMYGDDCSPSTNYPLVRLRNTATNRIYYARTYGFSTMAVATGASLQSAHFDLPAMPYGNYDLCVVANGISSHCVDFCHERKRCTCHGCGKSDCGCHRSCCCGPDHALEAEIAGLKAQLKYMHNTLKWLTTAGAAAPEGAAMEVAPKEVATEDEADEGKAKPPRRK
jgi:Kelch motif